MEGDRGTGHCPGWFKIVFEIFEMIFLPIPVSRWSLQTPARLLSNAERMALKNGTALFLVETLQLLTIADAKFFKEV